MSPVSSTRTGQGSRLRQALNHSLSDRLKVFVRTVKVILLGNHGGRMSQLLRNQLDRRPVGNGLRRQGVPQPVQAGALGDAVTKFHASQLLAQGAACPRATPVVEEDWPDEAG